MTVQFGYLTWDEDKQNAKTTDPPKEQQQQRERSHYFGAM